MIVLVDQDGVIAHWGNGYGVMLDTYGEEAAMIPRHADQRSFNLLEGRSECEQELIQRAMTEMRYLDLEPMDGAVDALHEMEAAGYEVRIVTSPWLPNPLCAQDKIDWVARHLGEPWAERVIITKDKTLVIGDVLIDDKPSITGIARPQWQHILFDQPYNRGPEQTQKRLYDWKDWRSLWA